MQALGELLRERAGYTCWRAGLLGLNVLASTLSHAASKKTGVSQQVAVAGNANTYKSDHLCELA